MNLERLHLVYRINTPGYELISRLKLMKDLTGLSLRNIFTDINLNEVIDNLKKLEYLKLMYGCFNHAKICENIITKANYNLKNIYLDNIGLSSDGFMLIASSCPNLELLYLQNCSFEDESCIKTFFEKTRNLQHLAIVQLTRIDCIVYDFLVDVPNSILPKLKSLKIQLNSNRSSELVSFL